MRVQQNMKAGQTLMDRFISAGVPLFGQFELTGRCNLRCSMCYVEKSARTGHSESDLSTEEWLRIMTQARDAGMLQAVLSGGEPLLHEGFRAIVQSLHHLGVAVVLNTNAVLLTADMVDFLAKYPPVCVNASLYAVSDAVSKRMCRSVGAWRKTLTGIDRLLERGIHVSLRTTLVQENVEELELIWEEGRRRNLPLVWVDTVIPPADADPGVFNGIRLTPDQYERAGRQLSALYERDFPAERHRMKRVEEGREAYLAFQQTCEAFQEMEMSPFVCQAGHVTFSVGRNGRMSPCPLLQVPWTSPLHAGFEHAWAQLRFLSRNNSSCKICGTCELSSACSACPARLKAENNADGTCAPYLRSLAVVRKNWKMNGMQGKR